MNERVIALLEEFDLINGVSGNEGAVAECMKKYLTPVTDESYTDILGNIVFIKKGKSPEKKIMITAHMDEIGFMVCDITDAGLLTILPIGYHNPNILVNQVMTIHTATGPVYGVIGGGKPIHQSLDNVSAGFSFADLLIDVGADNADEARDLGIKIGDIVNIEKPSHVLNKKYFSGKAVDNRSGCIAMILMMEMLKDTEIDATIYACGTVQEEIGLKGASALVRRIDPQMALCLDVGLGSERGEINPSATRSYVGKGPMIELYDWSSDSCSGLIVDRKMVTELVATAEEESLPYQMSAVLKCGTDACAMMYNNMGVLTGGISIAEKYIHTTLGVVAIDDVINSAKLGAAFLKRVEASFQF